MSGQWIQAAIDVEDLTLAKKIAFMALDNGVEWLEIGTPLLYTFGHEAIRCIRQAVGEQVTLVADYKSPFAALCAPQAAGAGANYIILTAGYNTWAEDVNIEYCRKYGVTPIFDLSVRRGDLRETAVRLAAKGAKYIFTRRSFASPFPPIPDGADNLPELLCGGDFKLGITSDDLDEARDSLRKGADWICFGLALRGGDERECGRWVSALRSVMDGQPPASL